MGFEAGNPQRALFARRVADLAVRHEQQRVGEELVRRFDVPDVPDGSGSSREEGAEDVHLPRCVAAEEEAFVFQDVGE